MTSCLGLTRLTLVEVNKDVNTDISSDQRSPIAVEESATVDAKTKKSFSSKKRKSSGKSDPENKKQSDTRNGGKRTSELMSASSGVLSPPKKGKYPVSQISLDVSDDDLDNYGDCDEGYVGMLWFEKRFNRPHCSEESSATSDSSSGLSSLLGLPHLPNKNGKRVVEKLVDYCDEDSVSEAVNANTPPDDLNEERAVCIECGKSNTRPKKWPFWVNCSECKNYYHKECSKFWRRRVKESELASFICKHCVKTELDR